MEQPFSVSYWGFTSAPPRLRSRRSAWLATTAHRAIAPYLFAAANIVVGLIALGTLRLIVQGRLLPPVAAPPPPQAAPA